MCFFFFNDTAPPEIYTLSLHDALPICRRGRQAEQPGPVVHAGRHPLARQRSQPAVAVPRPMTTRPRATTALPQRSEEHTSELQSRQYLVCRLLLEKKKKDYHLNT